jgi:hypothetical protein
MSYKTLLENLKTEEMKLFKITKLSLKRSYSELNEICINSLLFILYYLENNNYTLSHICLNDFEFQDQILFLVKDTHIVELVNNEYVYKEQPKEKIEFIPKDISYKNSIHILYKSVGLFMYYLIKQKIKREITDKDLNDIYYSKPYFFIKNTLDNSPCLIYI